jgi:hypothetical protein
VYFDYLVIVAAPFDRTGGIFFAGSRLLTSCAALSAVTGWLQYPFRRMYKLAGVFHFEDPGVDPLQKQFGLWTH